MPSEYDQSQKEDDVSFVSFLGVTGFDGLYIERRATRCTPVDTYNPLAPKPAKKLSAGVKSPYFGMKDFAFAYA